MGRVKEQMMQEQQDEFELDLSYQEWLMENPEPTGVELIAMSKEMLSPETFSEMLWHIVALNNVSYQPENNRGA